MTKNESSTNKSLEEALAHALDQSAHIAWYDRDELLIGDNHYKLQTNFREAFDLEQFKERYIDYLDSFDYIVGDIASSKLRLRGFYSEYRQNVREDQWITHLDDYLIEYCNFGAPYFVLERIEKLDEIPKEKQEEKKQRRNKRNSRKSRKRDNKRKSRRRQKSKHPFKKETRQSNQKSAQSKKDSQTENSPSKKETSATSKNKKSKQRFKIRPISNK